MKRNLIMYFFPDNFLYFLVLFTFSIIGGTHQLMSYKRSWLNFLNATIFFLCSIVVSMEYFNAFIESSEYAVFFFRFYGPISIILLLLIWLCLFYEVRPFSNRFKTNRFYHTFAVIVLIIPTLLNTFQLLMHMSFELSPTQLDGYWAFRILDNWIAQAYVLQTYIFGFFFTTALFIYAIIRDRENRVRKIILAILFMIFPIIYNVFIVNSDPMDWTVPNVGLPLLIQIFVLSWFLDDYRLFSDGFKDASSDLLDSISELSLQTDIDLRIKMTNTKFNSLFDISQNSMPEFLTVNSHYSIIEINKVLNNLINKKLDLKEINLTDKDGKGRLFHLKASELFWRGKHQGYTFLLSDLSEIKSKELELRELNNTKDRIFAIIGHDLRKPAIAFRGITKKVRYLIGKNDLETLYKYGEQIEENAFSLNKLTDNLLNWALMQRNVMPYNPQVVPLSDIILDTQSIFEAASKEKCITLISNIPASISVYVDPYALSTILINLLDNAIKYTPRTGKVKIEAFYTGKSQMKIRVSDTGIGLEEDKLKDLFLLKKNKSRIGTEGKQGAGLGLHLVKELVDLNHGLISVESDLGLGTSIEVTFPCSKPPHEK